MTQQLDAKIKDCQVYFEEQLASYFESRKSANPGRQKVFEAMWYSLKAGGKRFRPVLALILSDELGVHPHRVIDWAIAVEMIHTYSLIHDDLPCMDNDDFRRGIPTNHKVFGESLALLAGDALIFEAFHILNQSASYTAETKLKLIQVLLQASSIDGMITGQVMDIFFQDLGGLSKLQTVEEIHHLKTGALIRAAIEGAAMCCGLPKERVDLYSRFGELLGYAFQIKDDLLDATTDSDSAPNLTKVLTVAEVNNLLSATTENSIQILEQLGQPNGLLSEMARNNLVRQK